LEPQALLCDESLFCVANGYIGLRAAFEEGYSGGSNNIPTVRGLYANGFYDIIDMKQAEPLHGLVDRKQTIVNLADVQGMDLWADGQPFSMFTGKIMASKRRLDFVTGTYERQVIWQTDSGCTLEISIGRMASFAHPSIMMIDYRITPRNQEVKLHLRSGHEGDVRNMSDPNDPRLASHSVRNMLVEKVALLPAEETTISCITAKTARSGLSVATAVVHKIYEDKKAELRDAVRISEDENRICDHESTMSDHEATLSAYKDVISDCETTSTGAVHSFTIKVSANTSIRIVKFIAVCDLLRHGTGFAQGAVDELHHAMAGGPERLYAAQTAYLKRFWHHSAVEIKRDDDGAIDTAMRYNQFILLQSAGRDIHANVAAKGLSGEGYEGHYFWDTEMYLQPFFLLTQPEICKNLIAFRYATLDAARNNARALGHKSGALYPWRTINGEECSGYFVSGTAAYHINGAVANAVEQYWLATGDDDFLMDKGLEIVLEIARLWLDVGHLSGGEFHIHGVTGPDEYTCLVDNNYYTNALAQKNLRFAVRAADHLGGEHCRRLGIGTDELTGFAQAAAAMRLPFDRNLEIHAQDDSFLSKPPWTHTAIPPEQHPLLLHYHPLTLYRHQICKQADTVMAYYVCGMEPDDTMARSYAYYERITTHDSSLSRCMFSIVAAMLGDADKAGAYLADTVGLDLNDSHGNTKDGIHTANMGGSYMALVYGLAGLRFRDEGVVLCPRLPEGWQGYSFRFVYRGALAEVKVDRQGSSCRVLEGSANIVMEGSNR
jgi:alpha,alpha-trehalose phosphorylase